MLRPTFHRRSHVVYSITDSVGHATYRVTYEVKHVCREGKIIRLVQ